MLQFRKLLRLRGQWKNTKGVQPQKQHFGKLELADWCKEKQKGN